jgi:hypothetical protein
MNSFKMKALAVAVVGLAGLGMMGSAFGQSCPDPTANSNQGYATPNGPWSAETVSSATIVAVTPGLDGTNCAMGVALTASPSTIAKSLVTDNSPQNEPRYRVRFYVDLTHVATSGLAAGNAIRLLNANSTSGPAGISTAEVTLILVGPASGPSFRFQVADSGLSPSFFKTINVIAPTPAGVNRIEFDYNTGTGSACAPSNTAGSFCTWVTDGGAATGSDSAPSTTYNLVANSFGTTGNTWSGVKATNFGIFGSNSGYRTNAATTAITLDEFDSRRQTFIGQ